MGVRTKDLPAEAVGALPGRHATTHAGADEVSIQDLAGVATTPQKIRITKAGVPTATQPEVNFINGSNVTITSSENVAGNRIDVTIASSGGGPASQIATSGTPVSIDPAPPTAGMVLQASSASAAAWTQRTSPFIREHMFGRPSFQGANTNLIVATTAYWWYIGYVMQSFVPDLRIYCQSFSGTVTAAEIALATTPAAPNGTNQTITAIQTSTLASIVSTSLIGPTAPFASVAAGVHLWGGARLNVSPMGQFGRASVSLGRGELLRTASSGVLTPKTYATNTVPAGTTPAVATDANIVGILLI